MTTTKKIYKLNTFDNSIIEDYDYYYDENELIETSRPSQKYNNKKYIIKQDNNADNNNLKQDLNFEDYEYEINHYENQDEPQKYYLIGGKYYTNKPPKSNSKAQQSPQQQSQMFSDYSYKIRPNNVKKSPVYVYENDDSKLEILREGGIFSEYDKPRARVYQPQTLRSNYSSRTQSLDRDNRNPTEYTMYQTGSSTSTRKSFNQLMFNKPNHRREIDEPVIRDKPILNKPCIRGGSVIHK